MFAFKQTNKTVTYISIALGRRPLFSEYRREKIAQMGAVIAQLKTATRRDERRECPIVYRSFGLCGIETEDENVRISMTRRYELC